MYRIQTGFDIMQDMVDFFSSMKCSQQHFRVHKQAEEKQIRTRHLNIFPIVFFYLNGKNVLDGFASSGIVVDLKDSIRLRNENSDTTDVSDIIKLFYCYL